MIVVVSSVSSYQDLEIWKRSIYLVEQVYMLVKQLPREETYALSDQMRRAAVSIPSNIAEGASRNSTKEYIQFLYIALGSAAELETQLIIGERIGYFRAINAIKQSLVEIKKMLHGLISSLKRKER